MFQRWLGKKGIHYVATRFGPSWLKALSFDQKYVRGDWDFSVDDCSELALIVEKFAGGGNIIGLGCGGASIFRALRPDKFKSAIGVDLSEQAIRHAQQHANAQIHFEVGDMEEFKPRERNHVVLFSESIYYVRLTRIKDLLQRYAQTLTPDGVIIVTLAQPDRYRSIIELIREHFHMVEDRKFRDSNRQLLIFKAK